MFQIGDDRMVCVGHGGDEFQEDTIGDSRGFAVTSALAALELQEEVSELWNGVEALAMLRRRLE